MTIELIYGLAWFPMILLAILNGTFRQFLFLERMGEHRAQQLSTLLLILLFFGYTSLLSTFWPINSVGAAWRIGGIWFVMTNLFEVFMVIRLQKKSWQEFWSNHNLLQGRLWPLVPLSVLLLPLFVFQLQS